MAISKNQIKFIRQLEQKKFRRREGLFVAEGTKVVGDLLAHYQPHSLFATKEWLAEHASHLSPLTSILSPPTNSAASASNSTPNRFSRSSPSHLKLIFNFQFSILN